MTPVTEIVVPPFPASSVVVTIIALALAGALMVTTALAISARRGRRRLMAALARRAPITDYRDMRAVLEARLRHAGEILDASILLLWEEGDEPWLEIAHWTAAGLVTSRESPDAFRPFVAMELDADPFLCANAKRAEAGVVRLRGGESQAWRGSPLHVALVERFGLRGVVSCPVRVGEISGRLFAALDHAPDAEDLAIAIAATGPLGEAMSRVAETRRMLDLAALEERDRLSRELHDGVLQSLAGAALHLKRAERLVESEPAGIPAVLASAQQLLAEEQRDLRFYLQDLRPFTQFVGDPQPEFESRLRQLCVRVAEVWGLRTSLDAQPMPVVPSLRTLHELYRVAQEALVNVARHSQANQATLTLSADTNSARMTVKDNGRGFPFQGTFTDAELREQRLGPVTLKARVHAMGGSIAIDSTPNGARLDIEVPLSPPGG